jgi:hypothetical protein
VARLPERGVRHHDDDAGVRTQRPVHRIEDPVQRVHVLDAQQEDGRIEGTRCEFRRNVQPTGVADREAALVAVPSPGGLDQARAGVDPDVRRPCRRDWRRKNALAAPHVEDPFAGPWSEQVEGSRDRDAPVIGAAVLADPSVVPAGDVLPGSLSGRPARTRTGTARVPGHGRRR